MKQGQGNQCRTLELNLKNKLEETGKKQYETGRNRKKRGVTEKLVKYQSKLP